MLRKGLWILAVIFAIIIGFYPGIYLFVDKTFGLLSQKSEALLSSTLWQIGFYTHIALGGVALFVGWTQFGAKFRSKNPKLHRNIGKVYMVSVFVSSLAGIYIGFYATGGLVSSLGFITLGLIWFITTLKSYSYIKNKDVENHKKMMIYSYAACFSAVTLRIWLPILVIIFKDFINAYMLVAWLCWMPNVFVAYLIVRRNEKLLTIEALKV